MPIIFSEILRNLRKNNHLTQDELANKLKISKSAISMYENGNRTPDFETLELIADFFNVNLSRYCGNSYFPSEVKHNHFNPFIKYQIR